MSDAFISEYIDMPQHNGQVIQCGREPSLAEQYVSFTTTTQSAAFNAKTKFIRLHVKTAASYKFGANPTATVTTPRMAAGSTEFFGVNPGDKVALVDNP